MITTDVLFKEIAGKSGDLGLITLNRPQVLNSLNHEMVVAMHRQLNIWSLAPNIKAVVIRAAEGRAFCAGGDLRSTYNCLLAHDPSLLQFFHDEYQLNRFIFHFPKPYIALLDGITMGGGVGISIHGSHRVATDRLLFAMPETAIGFFPDVGGTYFLPRLPGKTGYYLGLTGARLASDDCVSLGIATQKVSAEKLPELVEMLAQHPFEKDAHASVTQIISQFSTPISSASILQQQQEIDVCFAGETIEEISQALNRSRNKICESGASEFAKKSPTSLKVTLLALQKGHKLSFDACMDQEHRLVHHFLQDHDFLEGIRAAIIDKDQKPKWRPGTISEVKESEVEKYFSPISEGLFNQSLT